MALSNILNEPKKEIVETVLGWGIILFWITTIGGGWTLLGYTAYHLAGHYWPNLKEGDRQFLAVFSPMVVVLLSLICLMAHEIGEGFLKKRYWLRKRLGL